MRIGLIGEDRTDTSTIEVLVRRISDKNGIGFREFAKNGKGNIKRKCLMWADVLHSQGCSALILVQDLDGTNGEDRVRAELESILSSSRLGNRYICIPVEELEAWFISDPGCIKKSLNLKFMPKFSGLPETIQDPKGKIKDQVFKCSQKEKYFMTKNNEDFAKYLNIEKALDKSNSFKSFHKFVTETV